MKTLLALLLLIPSLSWGNEIYLECIDRDMPELKEIVIIDLPNYTLWTQGGMFQYMIYQQNNALIRAQEANTGGTSTVIIDRLTGVYTLLDDDGNWLATSDCEPIRKKF